MGKWGYKYEIEYYNFYEQNASKAIGVVMAESMKEALDKLYDFYQDPDEEDSIDSVKITALEFGNGDVLEANMFYAKNGEWEPSIS